MSENRCTATVYPRSHGGRVAVQCDLESGHKGRHVAWYMFDQVMMERTRITWEDWHNNTEIGSATQNMHRKTGGAVYGADNIRRSTGDRTRESGRSSGAGRVPEA